MMVETLAVIGKERTSLELSLFFSALFCKVWCLTKLAELFKVPNLKDIKQAIEAETEKQLQESHTFSISSYTSYL